MHKASEAAALLRADRQLGDDVLYLSTGGYCLGIRSSSSTFLEQLAGYFAHVVVDSCHVDVMIEAYDCPVLELDLDWKDWAREPGKTGRSRRRREQRITLLFKSM